MFSKKTPIYKTNFNNSKSYSETFTNLNKFVSQLSLNINNN